jgi:hypothetical protein
MIFKNLKTNIAYLFNVGLIKYLGYLTPYESKFKYIKMDA